MRRVVLLLLAAALAAAAPPRLLHVERGLGSMNETLAAAASRIPFFHIGAENNLKFIRNESDPMYARLLGEQYQVSVAGNACKWHATEPQQGQFNFSECLADQASVRAAGIGKFRLHNLEWGSYNPSWLEKLAANATSAELAAVLATHIDTEIGAAGVTSWVTDVVNEPFADRKGQAFPPGGVYKNTTWWPRLQDPLEVAFRAADAARKSHGAPSLGLFVNDYALLTNGYKRSNLVSQVKRLRAAGVPVEGVGVQAHLFSAPSGKEMLQALQEIAGAGVRVQVTENDVSCGDPCEGERAAKQAQVFGDLLTACLATLPQREGGAGCEAHITWGFTDRHSWLNKPGHITNPLPFDANYNPKPAALEMLSVLQHWSAGQRDATRPWAY